MSEKKKRILKGTAVLVAVLALLLFIPDVRYKAKYWVKSAFAADTGWERTTVNHGEGRHELQLLSPVFHVDTLYPSMTGPAETHYFHLREGQAPELLWLTGYSTQVRDVADQQTLDEAYLCHNNLDYAIGDYARHWNLKNRKEVFIPRLATITQGQSTIDFPEGFGIPLMSDHDLSTATQVLNVNEPDIDKDVRHMVSLRYAAEAETQVAMRPLFQQSVSVMIPVDTSEQPLTSKIIDCSPALPTIAFLSETHEGHLYTGHWMIPEGRDTFSAEVTHMLALPFTTTLHYASVHVHPYCEALELIDLTTGEVVFRSEIENATGITKMLHIEAFSSSEGITLYNDHRYALTCYTNNTSGAEKDMMAVMLLYGLDTEVAANIGATPR